jgi:hypothetical protein
VKLDAVLMDLFRHFPQYRVLVCLSCRHAVPPPGLQSHIQKHHSRHPGCGTSERIHAVVRRLLELDLVDPACGSVTFPSPESLPLPDLPIYSGFACASCSFVARLESTVAKHSQTVHPSGRKPGRPASCTLLAPSPPRWTPTSCQRFFVQGPQSTYFRVNRTYGAGDEYLSPQEPKKEASHSSSPGEQMRAEVLEQLRVAEEEQRGAADIILGRASKTEISPWLEMTKWPSYLEGHTMAEAAPLAGPPHPGTEPLLSIFAASLDRLVWQARESIARDKVSVFDQAKIKRIFPEYERHRAPALSPLFQLRKQTYRRYSTIWARLLCFVYRTAQQKRCGGSMATLRHRLTDLQTSGLEQMSSLGRQLLALQSHEGSREQTQAALDRACLLFCVSLIDHPLKGDLFESVVVGFLAVAGIDAEKRIFKLPADFTPLLSGLIKIGQMLVMQRAVIAVEEGDITCPSDMLGQMHERLLTGHSPAPIGWAIWLRAYGKKMRNAMTIAGHIQWSEDGSEVWYKEETHLQMDQLKAFVHIQAGRIWKQLGELLLLRDGERMEDVAPSFLLSDLRDDATNRMPGWNFLNCPANKDSLPDGSHWLLRRVLGTASLREIFCKVDNAGGGAAGEWKVVAAQIYADQVDAFLERLLLLIHMTSGQPARGTELLTLSHSNGPLGRHRNIFIEQGLIGTVTSYHKGYSTTRSTKIIHRYLPAPVGEILVYYLWLVLPFWQQLQLLAFRDTSAASRSPYLWPCGETSWAAARLTKVLEREASIHLQTKLNTAVYRHLAIAISRAHLPGGSFQREYQIEQRVLDRQAAHDSWQAAITYARQVGDCGGHVEQRREQYRKASCEWHRFLGFQSPLLAPRKRPLSEVINISGGQRKRGKGIAPSELCRLTKNRDYHASDSD